MTNITRTVTRETLVDTWGLPFGYDGEIEVTILDHVEGGSGRWESYHTVVFIAPDDGKTYSADYSRGLTEYQDQRPWEDDKEVTISLVEKRERVITVTDWIPVRETGTPVVPTLAQLKKSWARNLEDDDMAGIEW